MKSYIPVSLYQDLLNQHIPKSYCLILNDLEILSRQNHVMQSIIDKFIYHFMEK